jgi:hypothetical protein
MSDLFATSDVTTPLKVDEDLTSSVTFGEYDEIGGKFKQQSVLEGMSVLYVNDVYTMCCGMVGSSGKVCLKGRGECQTSSHDVKTLRGEVVEGLYVKAGVNDFYLEPCLPKRYLSLAVLEEFLGREFKEGVEITKYFDFAKRLVDEKGSVLDSFSELERFNVNSEEAVNSKTPAKKRKSSPTEDFESAFREVKSNYHEILLESGNVELLDAIKELFQFSVSEQEFNRNESYNLAQKVNSTVQQLGSWPASSSDKPPPGVWIALAELWEDKKRVEAMEIDLANLGTANLYQKPPPPPPPPSGGSGFAGLQSNMVFDRKLVSIETRTQDGFLALENAIANVKGVPSYRSQVAVPTIMELENARTHLDRKVSDLVRELTSLKQTVKASRQGNKSKSMTVNLGSYSFGNTVELSAWCDKVFAGAIPFGVFVDVYTVLQRVISFMDVSTDTTLRDMDTRRKVSISADEAIAIESFSQPLPKLFRGSVKQPELGQKWLPGIPTKSRWEDEIGLSGVKITITENLETVRAGVQSAIAARLDPSQFDSSLEPIVRELQALAREMLGYSISFIEALITFMSDTYTRLHNSGFTEKSSWELVSKLVYRIFAKDCHAVRSRVAEHLDATQRKPMAVGVMWATLATHQVLKEYMTHGIENHPSIASEYVRFLVAHSGLTRLDKLEARVLKLETEMKSTTALATTAKRVADTALTKATEAMKEAKKR